MATPLPDSLQGTTITFDSGFFAQITSMSWSGITRESFATSHAGTTTAKTSAPADLFDSGELTVELLFAAQTRPPIDDGVEACTVTFSGGTTWACAVDADTISGPHFTSFEFTGTAGDNEELMTATGTIKMSGDITITAN